MRRLHFALLSLVLALAAQPLVAATYYVGTCKIGAYGTIGAAVAAVPAGSTIDVCPGTYAEQVTISQKLTLQGIFDDNSSQVVIAVPGGGLSTTSSIYFGTVAAQVEVTAESVKISNITVDGTAGSTNCPSTFEAGIFYSSGSSGTVNEVETRNQSCNSEGVGIVAENGAGATQSVTIENSNINTNSYISILACSDQTPSTLTASIKGNNVAGANIGIDLWCNVGGSVSGNVVSANGIGVYAESPSITVSGNTVTGGGLGIDAQGSVVSDNTVNNAIDGIYVEVAASVTSNHISNSTTGIYLNVSGATIKTNIITQSTTGIEFNCHTETVSGNTINGATTGADSVPAAFAGVNKFYNVATVSTGGC